MMDVFNITQRLVQIYDVRTGQKGFDEFGDTEIKAARFGCIGCPAIGVGPEPPRSVVMRHGSDSPLNELYDVWFTARRRASRCWKWHKRWDRTRNYGFGPIKLAVRKELFARVMDIQRRAGVVLITPEDEQFIYDCWERKVYPRGWSEADESAEPPSDYPLFETSK